MNKTLLTAAALALSGLHLAVPASAVSGGTTLAEGAHPFLARITTDQGPGCSGALISPQWVITAAACFPRNPDGGAPAAVTTVTVGKVNTTTRTGRTVRVSTLVRRADRDVMLAKLDIPVVDVAPVPVATTAPRTGEVLQVAGFGRTATDWVPERPRVAPFTVDTLTATTVALTGADGVDICKGDAGGPALRETGGTVTVAAINSTSWHHGCLAVTETRHGSTEARIDDLGPWITSTTAGPSRFTNDLSGWCLDQEYPQGVPGPATHVVAAWQCTTGANQQWTLQWIAADTVRVVNKESGWCLDQEYPQGTDGPATHTIGAWPCNNGGNQHWRVEPTPTGRTTLLVNKQSGWCLDQEYPHGTDGPATHVVASWQCNGGRNQQWRTF